MGREGLSARSRQRLFVLAIIATALFAGGLIYRSHVAWAGLNDAFRWVSHTREVEKEIQHLLCDVVDAESSQRGFLLTQNAAYCETYDAAVPSISADMARLRYLTSDNWRQKVNLDALDPILRERLSLIEKTVSLQKAEHHERAVGVVNTGQGFSLMRQIRAGVKGMLQEEDRLLGIREETLKKQAFANRMIAIAASALYVGMMLVTVFVVWRSSRARTLVTVCAWSKTIEYEGRWITFEEYLNKRFRIDTSHGLSPLEAEKFLRDMERAEVS